MNIASIGGSGNGIFMFCTVLRVLFLILWLYNQFRGLAMDSNWEESHALLGDRHHALGFSATSTTTSTPIYVGGTSSRE